MAAFFFLPFFPFLAPLFGFLCEGGESGADFMPPERFGGCFGEGVDENGAG